MPASQPRKFVPLLVGREREQAWLRDSLTATLGGQGGLVLIGGEAGIGKTALAEALCDEAAERDALVLVGRCYDLTETPPYGPWVELFGCYAPDGVCPALPAAFARRGSVGAVANPATLVAQVHGFFAALGARQPTLLFLDDLHWADPASLDLLRALARNLSALSVLIIGTYRADEMTRTHPLYTLLPALVREAHAGRLDLRRLDDEAVRTLVRALYVLPEQVSGRLVAYLHERAEGNPFFIGELLRALEEEAILRRSDNGWQMGDVAHVRLPTLLEQVIDARLMRLGEEAQQLLAIAAVIGQEVPLSLWATVARVSEKTLLDVVQRAVEAHVLAERDDGAQVRFVHALIRQALYDGLLPTLLPSRRRGWHRRVGEAQMAESYPDPDAVAYHFRQAGDTRAAEWLMKAGERAEHAYALLTAAERYQAAVQLDRAPPGDGHIRGWLLLHIAWLRRFADPASGLLSVEKAILLATENGNRVLAARAVTIRGILRCRNGEYRRGVSDLESGVMALDALHATDDIWLQEAIPVGFPVTLHGARGSLAFWLANAGRYHEVRPVAERAIQQAITDGRAAALERVHAVATYGLALAHAAQGRPDEARVAFARARMACHATGNHAGVAQTALHELEWVVLPYQTDQLAARQALAAESEEAWICGSGALRANDSPRLQRLPLVFLEGHWTEARQLALSVRAAVEDSARLFMATRVLATIAHHQGETDLAWSLVHEWLPADPATPPGDARFLDTIATQRLAATLATDAGDLPVARDWIMAHDRWLRWSEAVLGQAEGHLLWARYYGMAGDAGRAYQYAKEAIVRATMPRQPLALLTAYRLVGELDTESGRFSDAAIHLNTARSLAEASLAPYERALTLLSLAELQIARSACAAAQQFLDEARAICVPLGAAPALARLERSAARFLAPAHADGLTKRESEVLALLAAGKTNKEMATILFLSDKTIERHITSLYRKIGARGRADATAYAFRHADFSLMPPSS